MQLDKHGRRFVLPIIILAAVLTALIGTMAVHTVMMKAAPLISKKDTVVFSPAQQEEKLTDLADGESLIQDFCGVSGHLNYIGIFSAETEFDGFVTAQLAKDNTVLHIWKITSETLGEDGFAKLVCDDSVLSLSSESLYSLTFTYNGKEHFIFKQSDSAAESGASNIALTLGTDSARKPALMQILVLFIFILFAVCCVVYLVFLWLFKNQISTPKALLVPDYLFIAFFIAVAAFLISQYGDLSLTVRHAEFLISCIKNGNPTRFYTRALEECGYVYVYGANYNILLYLALAVIILPLKVLAVLFHIEISNFIYVTFATAIIAALTVYAGIILMRIVRNLGYNNKDAKYVFLIFATSSITVFSTCGFAQLDIIPIVFMLIALEKFTKKHYLAFSFFISFAIAMKSFALLIFVPLLLCAEKRVIHIIKHLLIGVSVPFITKLFMNLDPQYSITQKKMEEIYGFSDRLISSSLGSAMGIGIALLVCIVISLCLLAFRYGKTDTPQDTVVSILVYPLIIFTAFFTLITWHPQWIAVITPFLALACFLLKSRRYLLYTEACAGLFYLFYSSCYFTQNVDNYMVNGGLLPRIFGYFYSGTTLHELLTRIDNISQYLFSGFCAALISFTIITCIDLKKGLIYSRESSEASQLLDRVPVFTRMLPLAAFFFLTLILYLYC